MRKTKLAAYAVALTLAVAAMTGITTETAHAEEAGAGQAAVTDTDAGETADVRMDEETVGAFQAAYYNININGGTWDGVHYIVGGNVMTDAFFCDGTYTYYLQADGTPMKDRLTYHPDGEHVIYFDADGHEVFSDFAHITKSIAGDDVDDLCFFDVYGYMYVNKLTYDKAGQNLYYINEYGVMERGNHWFRYPYEVEDIDGEVKYIGYHRGYIHYVTYGFATENGALFTNTMTYKDGKQVYLGGNGTTVAGLGIIGGTWYMFDVMDCYLVETFSSRPDTYTFSLPTDRITGVDRDIVTYFYDFVRGTMGQTFHDEDNEGSGDEWPLDGPDFVY